MKRRTLFRIVASGFAASLAGCNGNLTSNNEPVPVLDILSVSLQRIDSQWELTASVRNTHNWHVSIHGVTLVAFSDTGEEVCRQQVGDLLEMESSEQTVTVTCDEFPAIITAIADESPCDGARIEIQYWIGSDEQRGAELPDDTHVWDSVRRQCDEPLPPERVLENVTQSGTTPHGEAQR